MLTSSFLQEDLTNTGLP